MWSVCQRQCVYICAVGKNMTVVMSAKKSHFTAYFIAWQQKWEIGFSCLICHVIVAASQPLNDRMVKST